MLESGNRVKQLTKMRKEMQSRFYLLYRYFRLKKYGEPLPVKNNDDFGLELGEIEDYCDEDDKALFKRI